MKIFRALLLTLIVLTLIIAGCSDDDCPNCPESGVIANAKGLVIGWVFLHPSAEFDIVAIFGNASGVPDVDSIIFGDSVLSGRDYINYLEDTDYESNIGWYIEFDEDGIDYMYNHGDTANFAIYGEDKSASCSFVILNRDSARVRFTGTNLPNDSVGVNDSITFYWNKIDHIDYYGILMNFSNADSGFYSHWIDKFAQTTDTSFTVTPDMYPDSLLSFQFEVTPFSSPGLFVDSNNVRSKWMTGSISSIGTKHGYYIKGWMPQPIWSGTNSMTEPLARRSYTPREYMEGLQQEIK